MTQKSSESSPKPLLLFPTTEKVPSGDYEEAAAAARARPTHSDPGTQTTGPDHQQVRPIARHHRVLLQQRPSHLCARRAQERAQDRVHVCAGPQETRQGRPAQDRGARDHERRVQEGQLAAGRRDRAAEARERPPQNAARQSPHVGHKGP